MATWEVVKFYWQTMLGSTGSTLTATSALSGTAVNNIFNMLEGDRWEATDTTSPQYLTYDAGAGNSFDADYLAIIGHNLNTIGATITLQYSATGAWAGEEVDAFIGYKPLHVKTPIFADDFSTSLTEIQGRWIKNDGGAEMSVVSGGVQGEQVLSLGNNTGDDMFRGYENESIPYDETKLYRVFARIRQTAGTGTTLIGVAGRDVTDSQWVNAIGSNLFTSQQFYFAASQALPSLGTNLVTNGDFETGDATGWSFFVDTGAGASASLSIVSTSPYAGTYNARIAITNGGSTQDNIQLHLVSFVSLVSGQDYFVRFAAKADVGRTINVRVRKSATPWTNYGLSTNVTLTTTWQLFALRFTANTTVTDADLQLWLGADNNPIDLDAIEFVKVSDIPFTEYTGYFQGKSGSHTGVPAPDPLSPGLLHTDVEFIRPLLWTNHPLEAGTYEVDEFKIEEVTLEDKVILREFPATGKNQHTRLKLTGPFTAAPKMAICIWGLKTSLDYARASFDPNAEDVKANVNLSDTGYLLGIHRRWSERSMSLSFTDADSALYSTVKTWWEGNGLNNFFVAWEHANNPSDVFLMHPDPKFNNPLTNGGAFRDITIKLKGRKE